MLLTAGQCWFGYTWLEMLLSPAVHVFAVCAWALAVSDREGMQDSVEERWKEQKAAAEEAVEPEKDEQGRSLNKKQRLQAKRAAEKERARQRQAAQGLMAPQVCPLWSLSRIHCWICADPCAQGIITKIETTNMCRPLSLSYLCTIGKLVICCSQDPALQLLPAKQGLLHYCSVRIATNIRNRLEVQLMQTN